MEADLAGVRSHGKLRGRPGQVSGGYGVSIEAMPVWGMRFIPQRQPRCTRSGVVQWDEKDPSVRPLGRAREVGPWVGVAFQECQVPVIVSITRRRLSPLFYQDGQILFFPPP